MLSCLGKFIIVLSLCFQAYVLFQNETIAKQFNKQLVVALQACKCIPEHIASHIYFYGRYVVVGLLASSALMLVSKCWCIKVLTLIGLSTLLYIQHQPFSKIPCVGCINFWEKVAVIGGIIYLMGSDCSSNCSKLQKCCSQKQCDKQKLKTK